MSVILGLSAKKRGGKNTCANFIGGTGLKYAGYISDFKLDNEGHLQIPFNHIWKTIKENEFNKYFSYSGIKMYSFADALKEFCMDVFGLTHEQCYGTEEQKNSLTQLKWENMPTIYGMELQIKNNKNPYLTAREVLQYFGTDIVRQMFSNAWVNATINKIKKDQSIEIAMITDCRFPNEVEGIQSAGGKVIRLTRDVCTDQHKSETALDNYSPHKFDLYVDNQKMSIEEQCESVRTYIESIVSKCRFPVVAQAQ